ncbi:hypothetical protein L3Q82_022497 [Scortum barcoo]|uniref:Uncharacterized protein n=1 Tax=Scortum barcoo TaxID=214431 RepID=A0ACB8X2F9_9TELE|nr:hypothetical protein L3Q82_022497 [Scortum barcoo]
MFLQSWTKCRIQTLTVTVIVNGMPPENGQLLWVKLSASLAWFRFSEEIYDRWSHMSIDTRKEAAQRMKVCVFWLPILLQREESSATACWAFQIGLIDANEDISIKQLHRIETLEAILRALEKGTLTREKTEQVFWISNMFNLNILYIQQQYVLLSVTLYLQHSPEVLDDALCWLEQTGEPAIRHRILDFGHPRTCFTALHFIFTEFAKYIKDMGTNLERTMKTLIATPSDFHVERSEEMKKKGNDNFKLNKYEDAVKFYSKAIKYYPDNHIIYGNRALCYIRCQKYLKAIGDGKRATLIKPLWAKGHYRYCEALFSMGEVKMALEANCLAQNLCKDDSDGLRDLEQQHQKFITEIAADLKAGFLKKTSSKRTESANRAHKSANTVIKNDPATSKAPQSKVGTFRQQSVVSPLLMTYCRISCSDTTFDFNLMTFKNFMADFRSPGKNEKTAQAESSTKDSKPSKSESSLKNGKGESSTAAKKKTKNRSSLSEEENHKVDESKAGAYKELRSMVQDAHTALTDLRSRNAEQAFSQALALLETNKPKELGLSSLDVMLLMYGRALALTQIGQPEELGEAQKLLEKIKSFEERTFQCLVFYAIGKVYVRENRFSVALEQFSDSLQMVKNQITPGKLTWPLTKEIVKETEPDYFKETLESAVELCKFPPIPDAICRLEKCLIPLKAEIYLTDPDFKGFIQICCCQRCIVEYHMNCWKSLKTTTFCEKNEKDFLQEPCLTPDCVGQICSIKIFGATGLMKCKFEAAITKPQMPKKPKVNQKCTSLKKLKSKEERRLRRKQHKQSFQEKQVIIDEILQKKEDSAAQIQQKAWLLYRDRVLLQVSQNMELLREEKSFHVSDLSSGLKPWLELDVSRGNRLAERLLNWQQEQLETLGQAVEVLLERKNRVWARIFIQLLSNCQDINPKLNNWACQLDNAGLTAAKSFIERHSGHLEQLDLAYLLNFGPLQENSPMKSRGRKKKQKEPMGVILLSGIRGVTPRDDWEQDYFEDDSLSFLHPGDPFSVPSHLREQVADFEGQYNNSSRHRGHYKKVLDNNPDPTKESLYDYFAQILEEHGPLVAEDPLLVGELENFPPLAQLKIQEAGGFEPFLLESLRFIKMGSCIGLAKHAVSLQQAGHGPRLDDLDDLDNLDDLDDLDEMVDLDTDSPDLHAGYDPAFMSSVDSYSSAQTEVHPVLPNPYVFGSLPPPFGQSDNGMTLAGNNLYPQWSNGDSQQEVPYYFPNGYGELDLYTGETEGEVCDPSSGEIASLTPEENLLKKHASVQTCPEPMSSVAVNTELHERFESYQGDINKKQKSIDELEQQMKEMTIGWDKVKQKHKEDLALLEEDVQKINANIQVTNKELALFQQKLEEEVKKDQKEKKANQEALKSLKTEIEELVEEHGRLARNIREKKASYDAKLSDFLELSNQSAAEKMSLEDEIKRCKVLIISATRRSRTAQLSVVESSRDQGLYALSTELTNAKALLNKLDEAAQRYQTQDLEVTRNSCRANIQETEKKISAAEAQYQEQMDQVRNGRRVSELLPVSVSNQPEPPTATLSVEAKDFVPSSSSQSSLSPPSLVQQSAAALPPVARQPVAPPQTHHKPPSNTVFDKTMERLATMFPDYSSSDLRRFIQEFRLSSGGSLTNIALQDMVGGVTQLILDHQERINSDRLNNTGRGSPAQRVNPPVWQQLGPQRATSSIALNVEDPCIICHDDMSPDDICVLECRHSFHNECIRSWLKEQSTCPTCRDHALLPDDFPLLPGRRRQAP